MAVTTFHAFPLASGDREWDGAAAEKRVRAWADAEDKSDITRVKSHLAKYHKKMGETASWERN